MVVWKTSSCLKLVTLFTCIRSFSPFPYTVSYPRGFPFLFPLQEVPSIPPLSLIPEEVKLEDSGPLPSGLGTSTNDFQATASYTVVTGFPCTLTRIKNNFLQNLHALPLGDLNQVRPVEFLLAYK